MLLLFLLWLLFALDPKKSQIDQFVDFGHWNRRKEKNKNQGMKVVQTGHHRIESMSEVCFGHNCAEVILVVVWV